MTKIGSRAPYMIKLRELRSVTVGDLKELLEGFSDDAIIDYEYVTEINSDMTPVIKIIDNG